MAFSFSRLRLPRFSGRELRFIKTILNDYRRRLVPAPHKPDPTSWRDDQITAAWLGHSTVLINFYGVNILTDPILGARAGLPLGPITFGPKRYVDAALRFSELPPIDLILLSHAHMDHFDLPTLRRFDRRPLVVTAHATSDLLGKTRLRDHLNELSWGERIRLTQTPNPKPQTPNPKPQTPNPFAASRRISQCHPLLYLSPGRTCLCGRDGEEFRRT